MAKRQQFSLVLRRAGQFPARVKKAEHSGLVTGPHLLNANSQRDIAFSCLQELCGHVQGRSPARAGVFDICDCDALDAHVAKCDLAGNHQLTLKVALGSVGKVSCIYLSGINPGIGKRTCDDFTSERFDGCTFKTTHLRHCNAGYVYPFHLTTLGSGE